MISPSDLSPAARFRLRVQAYQDGYCCRCGADVDPSALAGQQRTDWEVSAECPACIEGRDGEDCAND